MSCIYQPTGSTTSSVYHWTFNATRGLVLGMKICFPSSIVDSRKGIIHIGLHLYSRITARVHSTFIVCLFFIVSWLQKNSTNGAYIHVNACFLFCQLMEYTYTSMPRSLRVSYFVLDVSDSSCTALAACCTLCWPLGKMTSKRVG